MRLLKSRDAVPFREGCGRVPGEGAAVLVLERAERRASAARVHWRASTVTPPASSRR